MSFNQTDKLEQTARWKNPLNNLLSIAANGPGSLLHE